MKRPAFQFYPADWRNNAKLRRCSWAARGAWIEVIGLLHDSDEYGVLRWPLKEIANAVGCPLALVRELVEKDVLKGADKGRIEALVYVSRSGRKLGPPVTLIAESEGPVWYSNRMVRDEHVRNLRGDPSPKGGNGDAPKPSPKVGNGEVLGVTPISCTPARPPPHPPAPSSSSSSSATQKERSGGGTPSVASSPPESPPPLVDSEVDTEARSCRAAGICRLLRDLSIRCGPGEQALLEWAESGYTDEQIRDAVGKAASARRRDNSIQPVTTRFIASFLPEVAREKPVINHDRMQAEIERIARERGIAQC